MPIPHPKIGGRGFPISPPSSGLAFPWRFCFSTRSLTLLLGGRRAVCMRSPRPSRNAPGEGVSGICAASGLLLGFSCEAGGGRSSRWSFPCGASLRRGKGWRGGNSAGRTGRAGETQPFEVRLRGNVPAAATAPESDPSTQLSRMVPMRVSETRQLQHGDSGRAPLATWHSEASGGPPPWVSCRL